MTFPPRWTFLLALAGGAVLGCRQGELLGPVSGQVTCDGQPVPRATVLFHNERLGVHIMAEADEEGRFRAVMASGEGLPLGEYLVAVSPPIQDHPLGPIKAPPPTNDLYPEIPRRYRDVKTSGLKLTVSAEPNLLSIAMTKNPPARPGP